MNFTVLRRLDFLPGPLDGFKLNANLTLLDSDFAVRMSNGSYFRPVAPFSAPRRAWNVAVLYDLKRFSAKLAWNYTGLKLTERVNLTDSYRNRYDAPVTASPRISPTASRRRGPSTSAGGISPARAAPSSWATGRSCSWSPPNSAARGSSASPVRNDPTAPGFKD